MAFLDGKKKPMRSGGNTQREKFSENVAGMGKAPGKPEMMTHRGGVGPEGEEGGGASSRGDGMGTTTITHHEDGSHTVKHADGEEMHHPTAGHMLMGLHAKHEMGEGGHMHHHGEGQTTTHHVGMDGVVQGPHGHGSPEEAGSHLAMAMGGDGDMMGHGAGEPGMPGVSGEGDWAE